MSDTCRPERIDLDELLVMGGQQRADYLLVGWRALMVVEEAEDVRKRDIDQLVATVETIRRGSLVDYQGFGLIVAVAHGHRRVDPMVPKIAAALSRKKSRGGVVYLVANCDQQLGRFVKEYLC